MFFIYFKFCDLLVNSPFPRVPQELRIRKKDQSKNRWEGKEREQRRWIEAGGGKGHGLRKEETRRNGKRGTHAYDKRKKRLYGAKQHTGWGRVL